VTVHFLAPPRRWGLPNLMTSVGRVRQVVRDLRPDVVHAHVAHYARAAQGLDYPWLYTIHGVAGEEAKAYQDSWFDRLRYALYTHYDLAAVRRAEHLVAISHYALTAYQHRTPAQWYRISNPLTEDFFQMASVTEASDHLLLFVGSITEVKEIETLLRALSLVRQTVPDVRLQMAGRTSNPAYLAELEGYIRVSAGTPGENKAFLGALEKAL